MPWNKSSSFLWTPSDGADAAALVRMENAFQKPKFAMGEAWFMATERKMYPELSGELDELGDDTILEALREAAIGPSSFGPLDEWTDWFHFLMPRLLRRKWARHLWHPVELLFTGFVSQYPNSEGPFAYPDFRSDGLSTLGKYIMSPQFWACGSEEVPGFLNKWEGPSGVCGWYKADGLLSASMFHCIKYLSADLVGPWFQSAMSISNLYWTAQTVTWLVGAHPILSGEMDQPADLAENSRFDASWDWSHVLRGNYTGLHEPPLINIEFLPETNRQSVLEVISSISLDAFFEELLTNPRMEAVAAENAGLAERFFELYG